MDTAKKSRWGLTRRAVPEAVEAPPNPMSRREQENAPIKVPPPPTDEQPIGWIDPKGGGMVEWFWDGKAWTGRRELTPAGWVVY